MTRRRRVLRALAWCALLALVAQALIMARPIVLPFPSRWTAAYESQRTHLMHEGFGVRWYRAQTVDWDARVGLEWPGEVVSTRGGIVVPFDTDAVDRFAESFELDHLVGEAFDFGPTGETRTIFHRLVVSHIRDATDLELVEAGWPFLSAYSVRSNIAWNRETWIAGNKDLLAGSSMLDVPLGTIHGHALYVRPGYLMLNVLLLASPVFAMCCIVLHARGWWRQRRGQCPMCGYDSRGLDVCPECGERR